MTKIMGREIKKKILIITTPPPSLSHLPLSYQGEVDAEVSKVFEELAIDLDGSTPAVPQKVQEEEPQLSEEDAKLEARLMAL